MTLAPLTAQPLTFTAAQLDDATCAYAYERMPHAPHSPAVRTAYLAFELETLAQWADIIDAGMRIEFHDGCHEYANSAAMFDDIACGHLWTRLSGADGIAADHPMSRETSEWGFVTCSDAPLSAARLTLNDIFRAVHDINGHGRAHAAGITASFGPIGERNAWKTHRAMYSRAAWPALWCETRGQAAWTNAYADHAALALPDRPFATQKAGMPPLNLV